MSVNMDKIREMLAEHYFHHLVCRYSGKIDADRIESDGRKRRAVLKMVTTAGLIGEPDAGSSGPLYVPVTSKAYDEYPAKEPDLIARYNDDALDRGGTSWDRLPLAERKFVWSNMTAYRLFRRYSYGAGKEEPVAPTEFEKIREAIGLSKGWSLLVTNEVLDRHIADVRLRRRLEALKGVNLGWGLRRAGIIAEEEESLVKTHSSDNPFAPGYSLPNDPKVWAETIPRVVEKLSARARGDLRLIDLYTRIQAGIAKYGGWDKFLADYEAGILEEMQKPENADA